MTTCISDMCSRPSTKMIYTTSGSNDDKVAISSTHLAKIRIDRLDNVILELCSFYDSVSRILTSKVLLKLYLFFHRDREVAGISISVPRKTCYRDQVLNEDQC